MGAEDFQEKLVSSQLIVANVITQANTIEGMINSYIAEYYTRCPNGGYQEPYLLLIADVLENKFVSLNTKIDILFKIFKHIDKSRLPKGARNLFEGWLKIRNILAHGRFVGGKNQILHGGEFYEAQELQDQFMEKQIKILSILEAYLELRGQYFNDVPAKEIEK